MTDSLKPSLGFLLHDVARLARWNFDRQSQGIGLTRAQWSVLAHLKRNNGVQQKTLAQLMDIKPITLARHLDRLEADGLVRRGDDPDDRRAKRVFLAPGADPLLEDLQRLGQKVRKDMLRGISSDEEKLLMDMLTRIRDNLSNGGQ